MSKYQTEWAKLTAPWKPEEGYREITLSLHKEDVDCLRKLMAAGRITGEFSPQTELMSMLATELFHRAKGLK